MILLFAKRKRFTEMLRREDLEERRKAGKKAFFRGPFGFIERQRIDVDLKKKMWGYLRN